MKQILFIIEHLENERRKYTHRKLEVTFGITPVPILWPLAVLASMQDDASLLAWWDLAFPFSCQCQEKVLH